MRCLKMRVESPFSEKSSVRSILTRASGLGFLTFDEIKKIENWCEFGGFEIKMAEFGVIMSELNKPPKNEFKNFLMGLENGV